MRNVFAVSIAVILLGTAAGCDSNDAGRDVRTEAEKQQALRDSAFGSMTETMDRARDVEQLQRDRKSGLDAALENLQGR